MVTVRQLVAIFTLAAAVACSQSARDPLEPSLAKAATAGTGLTVTGTDPSSARRDTTLDVSILGSGIDRSARADFALAGVVGSDIHTNRTTFRSSKELVANITIASDAQDALYDVVVTLASGKKGIGTEKFAVEVYQELGSVGRGSSAQGVNDAGWIVGRSDTTVTPSGRAYVWDPQARALQSLGLLEAYDVNSSLTIVGYSGNGPMRWIRSPGSWQSEPLATLGGTYTFPDAINDLGQIVGRSQTSDGTYHPVLWQSQGALVDLGLPAGFDYGQATGLTQTGMVIGRLRSASNAAVWQGFVWRPDTPNGTSGQFQVLPAYGNLTRNFPEAVNDAGVIAGYSEAASGFPFAVVWQPLQNETAGYAVPTALPTDGQPARAFGINNGGVVVGQVGRNRSTSVAFVWDAARGMRQLFTVTGRETTAKAVSDGPVTYVVGYSLQGDYLLGTYTAVRWQVE
jgi:probable HAF family extracellular repeat protein